MYGRWPLQERVSKYNTAPQMFIELDSDFDPRERLLTWKAAPPCTDVFTSSVSVYEIRSAQSEIVRTDVTSIISGCRCRDWRGFAVHLGGFAVLGVRLARYLMVRCTLSGSGGWRSAWREPWGNPAWKNDFHMEWAVWLPLTSKEGAVGLVWLMRGIYEQCCLFINYLKWTAGTPSLYGLNSPV